MRVWTYIRSMRSNLRRQASTAPKSSPGDQQSRRSSVVHPVSPLPPPSPAYLALMTSLDDLPSGYTAPLPVDEHEADAGGSVGEGDYEQSAVAALLGMAACQAVFPLSRVSSYGSAKSELSGGRRLADSRENSSDDLSTDSGDVKRRRVERSDLGGARPVRPVSACTLTRHPHIPHRFFPPEAHCTFWPPQCACNPFGHP